MEYSDIEQLQQLIH